MKIKLFLITAALVYFTFEPNELLSKKVMTIGGKFFECKQPKNSFERTRGVRTRTCMFSKKDKENINKLIMEKKFNKKNNIPGRR